MKINDLIAQAIEEDIKDGDHSGNSCIPPNANGKAKLFIKEDGILAGIEVARQVFYQIDPSIEFISKLKDGDEIRKGDIAFEVRGNSRNILKAERLSLNFMQRMSGIATHTKKLNDLISDLPCKLLDTRKTTPNFRVFEKMAVKMGGGLNHRFGLYDMIMIKDNHIDYAGGIKAAIEKSHKYITDNNFDLKIEIEARDLSEVDEILKCNNVDRIMLDNFSYSDMKIAVKKIGDFAETEASGGITRETIREYALCGVNFISVGALTHQISSLDMSLKASFNG